MKRYNSVYDGVYTKPNEMVEEANGDWVRWEDVEALEALEDKCAELEAKCAELLKGLEAIENGVKIGLPMGEILHIAKKYRKAAARRRHRQSERRAAMSKTKWPLADIEGDLQMPTAVLREIIRQCKEAKDQRDELLRTLEIVAGLYGVATSDCRYSHLEVATQAFYMASIARAAIAKAKGESDE